MWMPNRLAPWLEDLYFVPIGRKTVCLSVLAYVVLNREQEVDLFGLNSRTCSFSITPVREGDCLAEKRQHEHNRAANSQSVYHEGRVAHFEVRFKSDTRLSSLHETVAETRETVGV